jgi:ribosomal-protein-alanine N-acetyltransferase
VRLSDPGLTIAALRLRPWSPGDAPALAAAWSDVEVAASNRVPVAGTVEAAEAWIAGWSARAEAGRALDLVIGPPTEVPPADAAAPWVAADPVWGEVGLGPIDWPRRTAELGYWVAASERRRGLASTAVDLLARWALATLPLTHLVARVPPDHGPSAQVLARAHFVRRGRLASGHDLWARTLRGAGM